MKSTCIVLVAIRGRYGDLLKFIQIYVDSKTYIPIKTEQITVAKHESSSSISALSVLLIMKVFEL